MANATDAFLEAYKNLEAELKLDNLSVLDYENNLDNNEKLKVCRIIRNYISHNDTIFIIPSTEMVKYIQQLIVELRKQKHTVKDEFKRVKLVTDLTIKNLIPLVDKSIVPIDTKMGIFLLDKDYLIHQLALGNRKLELPKKFPKYEYVSKDTLLDNLHGVYIVTDTGTSIGKYLGLLII